MFKVFVSYINKYNVVHMAYDDSSAKTFTKSANMSNDEGTAANRKLQSVTFLNILKLTLIPTEIVKT